MSSSESDSSASSTTILGGGFLVFFSGTDDDWPSSDVATRTANSGLDSCFVDFFALFRRKPVSTLDCTDFRRFCMRAQCFVSSAPAWASLPEARPGVLASDSRAR